MTAAAALPTPANAPLPAAETSRQAVTTRLQIVPEPPTAAMRGAARQPERRSAARRSADAGTGYFFRAALPLAGLHTAALLLGALNGLWTFPFGGVRTEAAVLDRLLLLIGIALLAAWWAALWVYRHRRPAWSARWQDRRRWQRTLETLVGANLVWLGATSWLDGVAGSERLAVATLLHVTVAVTAAATLPMAPRAAGWSLAGLASPALAWWLTGQPLGHSMAALLLIAALAVAALLWRHGSHWQRMGQRLIEVGDRVRSLTEERDAAIRADHDKLRFVAAASHDLRQPMHALGLFVATLEGRLQGTPDEPLTHSMMRSVETLDRSFTALLDISRLDAGTVCPNLQRFPLRDLFRRLHMHFAGLAEEHGLGLRFSPGGKTVTSDPQLLERILANLIQNALRYTREGGVVVLARTTRSHIHVEVWDSGCGISAPDLPHIFDEFYRAGHAGRDAAQGLGMGLAIVKRLAVLLGLTLEVASRPGRGTMFRIGIPIGSAPDVADATAAADTIPAPVLQAGTILVIDDEADIRDGLATLLRSWGFDAHAAADIAAARSVAQVLDGQLDLVISDLHLLDGEDGLDAVAAVRQACARRVPAMIVTGDTSPAEIRRASASGNMVLFKPLQPSKLFGVLRSIVR